MANNIVELKNVNVFKNNDLKTTVKPTVVKYITSL